MRKYDVVPIYKEKNIWVEKLQHKPESADKI